MTRPTKYPLTSLLEHRGRKVESSTAELADAVRAEAAAAAAHARAEAARDDAEARARRTRAEEAERLARGELRAVDLARAEGWEVSARAEIAQLDAAEASAASRVEEARGETTSARTGLAGAMADRDVVAKDRSRFEVAAAARKIAAEEEGAAEAWGARRAREAGR